VGGARTRKALLVVPDEFWEGFFKGVATDVLVVCSPEGVKQNFVAEDEFLYVGSQSGFPEGASPPLQ
jgi:hypothetical protein